MSSAHSEFKVSLGYLEGRKEKRKKGKKEGRKRGSEEEGREGRKREGYTHTNTQPNEKKLFLKTYLLCIQCSAYMFACMSKEDTRPHYRLL